VLVELLLLAVGLALLVGGAEGLVRGGSGLAQDMGISPLVVGLTVVAFGTSAPELAVNVDASLRGESELSFGNIIGSNIANIGLVIGIFALLRPIPVEGTIIRREVPMMIASTVAALAMGMTWTFGAAGVVEAGGAYDQSDGIVLLLFFGVFLYYTVADVFRQRASDPFVVQTGLVEPVQPWQSLPLNLALTGGGLAGLVIGAKLTVSAAVDLAEAFGVSQVVIGLSVVAVGTSLPELVTSIVAAVRSQSDLAVGNIVGSNLFNLLFIGGISATLNPIPVPARGLWDLLLLLLLSVLLLFVCMTHRQQILRREGAALLALYFAYMSSRVLG